MQKKTYSEEFKVETLRLVETSGKSVREIEEELGLSKGIIYKWRRRYRVNEAEEKLERSAEREAQAEIRRLERENAVLRQERDILKKALGIFSKEQR
jgi:transposase